MLGEESKHPRTLAPTPLLRPLTCIYASRTLRHVEIVHLFQINRSLWKNVACEQQFFFLYIVEVHVTATESRKGLWHASRADPDHVWIYLTTNHVRNQQAHTVGVFVRRCHFPRIQGLICMYAMWGERALPFANQHVFRVFLSCSQTSSERVSVSRDGPQQHRHIIS